MGVIFLGQVIGPPNGLNMTEVHFPVEPSSVALVVAAAGASMLLLCFGAWAAFYLVKRLFARVLNEGRGSPMDAVYAARHARRDSYQWAGMTRRQAKKAEYLGRRPGE